MLVAALSLLAVSQAAARDDVYDSGGRPLAWRQMELAERASIHGHISQAIEMASKILAAAPNFGEGYVFRANFYIQAARYDEALADIERAASMHPKSILLSVLKAEIAMRRGQPDRALAELGHLNDLPYYTVWRTNYEAFGGYSVSEAYALRSLALELERDNDNALADFRRMLTFETDEPQYILTFHCWNAAVAGLSDMAEISCDEAVAHESHEVGAYESRGFAHLKMRHWAKAIADYDHALALFPDLALARYGRGLAKLGAGDAAAGNADLAAARSGEPDVANIMARLGVRS